MKKNGIESFIKEKNNKKMFHEEIFMPKFFLNLLDLTRKAQKLRKNYKNPINQDLVLDFKTTFSHMPKINFLSCKAESNDKHEILNKNRFQRLKYISLLNSHERLIVKSKLPKISYKFNSTSYENNREKNRINTLNHNIKNDNCFISKNDIQYKVILQKIKKLNLNLNKSKSYANINFIPTKKSLSNISDRRKRKINYEISKNNFSLTCNLNTQDNYKIKTDKENKFNNNYNSNSITNNIKTIYNHNNTNLFISNYIDSYIQKKSRQNKISNKSDKTQSENLRNNARTSTNINNNIKNINEIYFQKESKKKVSNSVNKSHNIPNYALKKIPSLPANFNTKEYLLNKYLKSKYIDYPILSNISINSSNGSIYFFNISKMYRKQIINYMKHRINWKHIDYSTLNNNNNINLNFEWKYYSCKLNYKKYQYNSNIPNRKLRMINLFEKNYEIGNKKNMFLNLISYCDEIKYNVFDIVPFTMIFSNTKDIDFETNSLKEIIELLQDNKNTKKNIIINKLYKDQFWFDKNYEKISNQILYFNKNYISDKNYWILKPTDMYQGKYIEIANTYDDISKKCLNMFKGVNTNLIKEIMEIEEENQKNENITICNNNSVNNKKKLSFKKSFSSKMYCCSDIIIQKYLDKPLLYKKRKFDIRCFALLDSNLNLYYCREGHLKGSSELYNVDNANKFIHITNYSFQKKSSSFERYEYGNEISYEKFKLFLKEEGFPPDKFNEMIEEMKFLIKISFKAVSKKIYKTKDVLCFELFGYDFIIDNEFKPWILEINNNPGLGISSPVIQKIIPRMIDDAFRLTIDKVFETRYDKESFDEEGKYKTRFPIEGYRNDENIFEFLCNIK